jgi:hypothetical protein
LTQAWPAAAGASNIGNPLATHVMPATAGFGVAVVRFRAPTGSWLANHEALVDVLRQIAGTARALQDPADATGTVDGVDGCDLVPWHGLVRTVLQRREEEIVLLRAAVNTGAAGRLPAEQVYRRGRPQAACSPRSRARGPDAGQRPGWSGVGGRPGRFLAGAVRVASVDQVTMPAQDRLRGHDQLQLPQPNLRKPMQERGHPVFQQPVTWALAGGDRSAYRAAAALAKQLRGYAERARRSEDFTTWIRAVRAANHCRRALQSEFDLAQLPH